MTTLNLYHDKLDWPRRRSQFMRSLRELHPDAIALQEMLPLNRRGIPGGSNC
ncbi:hypothetical protein ACFQGW_03340 [Xanthomonas theicola]|uniref:hypothetical protein n=1 Tax=Xanthomonas theicola TaxID=56464 RepID=UPI00360C50B3